MNKILHFLYKHSAKFLVFSIFALPFISHATGYATGATGVNLSFAIENPIKATNINELIDSILDILFKVGVPIIAVFIILSGFNFVMARGNPAKLKTARTNFVNVLIGTAIFLGAYTISKAIIETINSLTK